MPPSGYSQRDVLALREFLESCSEALSREAAESGRSLSAALVREIGQIESILPQSSPLGRPVLELTAAFYREVVASSESGDDYSVAVETTLKKFANDVSSIHVPL